MAHDLVEEIPEGYDDEIDLRELVSVLWQGKISIVIGGILGAILSVGYALSLPNIYTAVAVMAPKAEGAGLSGLAGQFGGLAGLAGIDIGGGGASKTQIALETLRSRAFFAEYIYEDVLVELMAVESWNRELDELVLADDMYDPLSQKWIRDVQSPVKKKPSVQEAYKVFIEDHLIVAEEKKTSFVSLTVKHFSPTVARDWVLAMLRGIEASVREKEVREAVLANASEEYVFEVIEPPVAAEIKSEPKRALICVLGTLLSGMLSFLYVLIKHYGFKKREKSVA